MVELTSNVAMIFLFFSSVMVLSIFLYIIIKKRPKQIIGKILVGINILMHVGIISSLLFFMTTTDGYGIVLLQDLGLESAARERCEERMDFFEQLPPWLHHENTIFYNLSEAEDMLYDEEQNIYVGGRYNILDERIMVFYCFDIEYVYFHEFGHHVWYEVLTSAEREGYATERIREADGEIYLERKSVEEDFADMFANKIHTMGLGGYIKPPDVPLGEKPEFYIKSVIHDLQEGTR